MPEVSRTTLGFSQIVTPLNPRFLAYSNAAVMMRLAAGRVMIRRLTARSEPGVSKMLELGMGAQSGADLFRGVRPFDAGVHALRILAEYGGFYLWLVEAPV